MPRHTSRKPIRRRDRVSSPSSRGSSSRRRPSTGWTEAESSTRRTDYSNSYDYDEQRRRRDNHGEVPVKGNKSVRMEMEPAPSSAEARQTLKHKVTRVAQQPIWIQQGDDQKQPELNLRDFIAQKMRQRECCEFVPTNDDPNVCGCGRSKKWHRANGIGNEGGRQWMSVRCSKQQPCSAYGEVMFSGFGNASALSYAPYVRLDAQTDPADVWTLMFRIWKVPPPKMVISVTGGARKFSIPRKLRAAFKRGLSNVATSTDAWIVTGGTATGVMQFVGEALQECRLSSETKQIVAIGIASWGVVDNQRALLCPDGIDGNFPCVYHVRDCQNGYTMLDHNHTHFLLADNGTQAQYGVELELRAKLQEYIRGKCTACLHSTNGTHVGACMQTPVVLIVCEGGANTVKSVADSLICNTPCVIIQSSGRAADVLAMAYKLTSRAKNNEEAMVQAGRRRNELYDEVLRQSLCPSQKPAEIDACVDQLLKCLAHKDLMTIFTPDDSNGDELDKAILKALLTSYKSDIQSQIDLAVIWNRPDIARENIFSHENRGKWQKLNFDRVMSDALMSDRHEFVSIFMDNGVHLGEFLTVRNLIELYKAGFDDDSNTTSNMNVEIAKSLSLLDNLFVSLQSDHKTHFNDADVLPVVGRIISYLVHDRINRLYDSVVIPPGKLGSDGTLTTTTATSTVDPTTKQALTNIYADRGKHNAPRPIRTPGSADYDSDDSAASGRSRTSSVDDRRNFQDRRLRSNMKPQAFNSPERELFLWALLFDKQGTAQFFWNLTSDPIGGALIAANVLKSMSVYAAKLEEGDLAIELMEKSQYYQKTAVGILTTCYSINKAYARKLVVRKITGWGDTTLLSLAEAASLMDFMESSCTQTALNEIWYGQLHDYTPDWKVILVCICPLLMYSIQFKRNPHGQLEEAAPDNPRGRTAAAASARRRAQGGGGSTGYQQHSSRRRTLCCSAHNVLMFYRAPITKFYLNLISYVFFLTLYTYVVMSALRVNMFDQLHDTHVIGELIVWLWMLSFALKEIYQWATTGLSRTLAQRIRRFFESFWNHLDFVLNLIFLVACILRLSNTRTHKNHTHIKFIYAVSLLLNYLRMMNMLFISRQVGPKIIMIIRMLKDLAFFLVILALFIVSFGVAMQALLHPNQDFSWRMLYSALYQPYWQLFGELFLEYKEGVLPDQCESNATLWSVPGTLPPCAEQTYLLNVVPVVSAIYMMLSNILLLNLLIAMFSYSFQLVQERSNKVWRFYRYYLVYKYYGTPVLPPPFVLVELLVKSVHNVWHVCVHGRHTQHNAFCVDLTPEENLRLTSFVKQAKDKYVSDEKLMGAASIERHINESGFKMSQVLAFLDELRDDLQLAPAGRPDSAEDESSRSSLQERFEDFTRSLRPDQRDRFYSMAKEMRAAR